MVVRVTGLSFLAVLFAYLAVAMSPALAVSMDKSSSSKDECAISLGSDAILISGYQPDLSHDKYCEEFPSTGRVILTFDLGTPAMRDSSVEVRIVKDPTVPLSENADLAPITEAYLAPKIYPSGTFTFEHDFKESGSYIGLVTLARPNGDRETARFKFTVGRTFLQLVPLILGGVLVASMVFLYWRHSGPRPKPST